MKLKTTRFGEIDIAESSIFEFVNPILGYESETHFVLVDHKANSNFRWLQSVKTPELAFVLTVAGLFGIDYSFELADIHQEELGIEKAEDIVAMNIVVIPHENPRSSTINLLAPIILNITNKKAGQIILPGSDFRVDYPLIQKEAVC